MSSPADTFAKAKATSAAGAGAAEASFSKGAFPGLPTMEAQWEQFLGEFDKLSQLLKAHGTDPEVLKSLLCELTWQELFEKRLLKDPVNTFQQLEAWQNSIQAEGAPGVLRDGVVLGIHYLKTHLNDKAKLKQGNQILVELMLAGGYKKALRVGRLFTETQFSKAPPVKKGQYLIEAMGPLVIKLFQTLSTVPGLFPEHVQASFKPLYKNITPVPGPQIIQAIEESLGKPIQALFAEFNPETVHVGSIAQVHEARLYTGEKVAVKVVKPGIVETMVEDLAILDPLVKLVKELAPHLDMEQLFNTFASQLVSECDMSEEAGKLKVLGGIFAQDQRVTVPQVFDAQSSDSVLTMSWLEAESLEAFQGKPEAPGLAKKYWQLLLDQVLHYGAFQADPHPGNVPYNPKTKKFALLDAGQIYTVPETHRDRFGKLLVSLALGLPRQIAQHLLEPFQPLAKVKAVSPQPVDGLDSSAELSTGYDPKAIQQFQQWVQAHLEKESPTQDMGAALRFLNEASKQAKTLALPFAGVDPQMLKALFVALMVTKTLDKNTPVVFSTLSTLFSRVLWKDWRFATEAACGSVGQGCGWLWKKTVQEPATWLRRRVGY